MIFSNNRYEIASALDPGIKRRNEVNQDDLAILPHKNNKLGSQLIVLADGMGGHAGGNLASGIVIQKFRDQYKKWNSNKTDPKKLLEDCIQAAYQEMIDRSIKKPVYRTMGSTVVSVILEKSKISLANVGDSRAYIINENEVRQISFDHSYVGEQIRLGLITSEEALRHPKRNILNQSISPLRTEVKPYCTECEWMETDTVLLCSDGLWSAVSDLQLQTIVCELEPAKAVKRFVQLANMNQGLDNISVIIVRHK